MAAAEWMAITTKYLYGSLHSVDLWSVDRTPCLADLNVCGTCVPTTFHRRSSSSPEWSHSPIVGTATADLSSFPSSFSLIGSKQSTKPNSVRARSRGDGRSLASRRPPERGRLSKNYSCIQPGHCPPENGSRNARENAAHVVEAGRRTGPKAGQKGPRSFADDTSILDVDT